MQYHLDGFRTGNPDFESEDTFGQPQDKADVVIVGCGPAGLTLAAQLARIGGISVRIFERKTGPLEVGQADGIACRSMEMFEAFGFADAVLRESYWVNETTFWRPGEDGVTIARADRIQDVEDDLSHQPHVILNQARIHDFYLEIMKNSASRLEPDYGRRLVSLHRTDETDYPVKAVFEDVDDPGNTETIRAKYVVGCDGARSEVRRSLGYALKGEAARQLWGVMDVLAVTGFPDIRLKTAIQSAEAGSILIIPREGGYLVRLYVELDVLQEDERASDRTVTAELLEQTAGEVLAPYQFEVKEVAWCSAYEIGQRVCDSFDDVAGGDQTGRTPRIFIAGDACHTHSPKAGQGMNVSMADTFNLGWKLAAVLKGQSPETLLHSYSAERQAKAQELIDFDRDMARLFSERSNDAADSDQFQRYFQKHGRYTAGVETRYDSSFLVGSTEHQDLAKGLETGKRFHSAIVCRVADAKYMQLCETLKADGRWRIFAFAPENDCGKEGGPIAEFCNFLYTADTSPLRRFTPEGLDIDAIIDVRAIFQQPHRELKLEKMPPLLLPAKGRYGLTDYEKIFSSVTASGQNIFEMRNISKDKGALVVVRPDQFVSFVLPISERAALGTFFDGVLIPQKPRASK